MKTVWVYFTENNARVIVNPPPHVAASLAVVDADKIVRDPDLSAVRGFAPHFWKLVDGAVLPMTPEEQEARLRLIAGGVDNFVPILPPQPEKSMLARYWANLGNWLRRRK